MSYQHFRSQNGFTLIEVIVSLVILSVSLVLIMQLFSGGLQASRTACDFTRAIVHAKGKMEELSLDPVSGSGEFEDGFKWETDVQPYEGPGDKLNVFLESSDFNLMKIKVKILWVSKPKKDRSVELTSLRIISEEND
ncbi:MAG TPA: type II secretion system protein [Nitrospirae bacterium]|nr:hypothetical protein BMS3Abin10_01710 [bacterium BMS3Abin10]GBE39143.1 hypothetical protein BMS3Bbin08_01763 [bacterium BMS3Bbin08]HDH00609.1 type II secretion system protein [Nitrospirota bacterium]HDH51632.1 type II secretion system protein [Nitrospirota bacterium]HDK82167.1 type II secretion system protein [Nitrospirota bacterium]